MEMVDKGVVVNINQQEEEYEVVEYEQKITKICFAIAVLCRAFIVVYQYHALYACSMLACFTRLSKLAFFCRTLYHRISSPSSLVILTEPNTDLSFSFVKLPESLVLGYYANHLIQQMCH